MPRTNLRKRKGLYDPDEGKSARVTKKGRLKEDDPHRYETVGSNLRIIDLHLLQTAIGQLYEGDGPCKHKRIHLREVENSADAFFTEFIIQCPHCSFTVAFSNSTKGCDKETSKRINTLLLDLLPEEYFNTLVQTFHGQDKITETPESQCYPDEDLLSKQEVKVEHEEDDEDNNLVSIVDFADIPIKEDIDLPSDVDDAHDKSAIESAEDTNLVISVDPSVVKLDDTIEKSAIEEIESAEDTNLVVSVDPSLVRLHPDEDEQKCDMETNQGPECEDSAENTSEFKENNDQTNIEEWIDVNGGSLLPWPPEKALPSDPSQLVKKTCSDYGLRAGVYEFHRCDGTSCILVLREEEMSFDDVLMQYRTNTEEESATDNRTTQQLLNTIKSKGYVLCSKCELGFLCLKDLKNHQNAGCVQRNDSGDHVLCIRCKVKFESLFIFRKHVQLKHHKKEKLSMCSRVRIPKIVPYHKSPLQIFSSFYNERLKYACINVDVVSSPNLDRMIINIWSRMTGEEKLPFQKASTDHNFHKELYTSTLLDDVFTDIEKRMFGDSL